MPPQTTPSHSPDELNEQTHTPSAFEFLAELLPARNLTDEVIHSPNFNSTYHDRAQRTNRSEKLFDRMARRLHRDCLPHLVLTGAKGIGRASAVRELARMAARGEYPFLEDAALWPAA